MRQCQQVLAVAIGTMAWTVAAHAQEPSPRAPMSRYLDERAGMGLDAAVVRAVQQAPLLRAVRADVAVARAQRQQAGLRPNPRLSAEHRDEPSGTDALTTIGIEWPLQFGVITETCAQPKPRDWCPEVMADSRERLGSVGNHSVDTRVHAIEGLRCMDDLAGTLFRDQNRGAGSADAISRGSKFPQGTRYQLDNDQAE